MKSINNFFSIVPLEPELNGGDLDIFESFSPVIENILEDSEDATSPEEVEEKFVIPVELFESVHPLEASKFQLNIIARNLKASIWNALVTFPYQSLRKKM